MVSWLYRLHRRLALIVIVPIFLWTASGISHPLMTWLSPRPPRQVLDRPAIAVADLKVEPADVIRRHNLGAVSAVGLVAFDGKTRYRIAPVDGLPEQYDAATGAHLPDGERAYAELLARTFLDDRESAVASIRPVTQFDSEYKSVFRYLPAYRVELARPDGLAAYVDPAGGRLGAAVDTTRSWLLWFFDVFHNWEFLPGPAWLRLGLLVAFSAAIFLGALSGLVVYGLFYRKLKRPTKASPTRAWTRFAHRVLGLGMSVAMLMFSFSGGYHAFVKLPNAGKEPAAPNERITADELTTPLLPRLESVGATIGGLRVVRGTGGVSWVVEPAPAVKSVADTPASGTSPTASRGSGRGKGRGIGGRGPAVPTTAPVYLSASEDRTIPGGDESYAGMLAARYSGVESAKVASAERLTAFTDEYGQFFRVLPVVRVELDVPGHAPYFIDPATGGIVTRGRAERGLEAVSFNLLHKWRFLDPLGRDTRDGIMIAFNVGTAAVAGLGLMLLIRKRRRAPAATSGAADADGGQLNPTTFTLKEPHP